MPCAVSGLLFLFIPFVSFVVLGEQGVDGDRDSPRLHASGSVLYRHTGAGGLPAVGRVDEAEVPYVLPTRVRARTVWDALRVFLLNQIERVIRAEEEDSLQFVRSLGHRVLETAECGAV